MNNDQQYCLKHCEQCCFYCFSKAILFTYSYLFTSLLVGMQNRAGIAASVRLPPCSTISKPVYFKRMHLRPNSVPGPGQAGGWQRREHDSSSRRRRISKNVASAAAVVAAASSFFALKRPPAKIITQQQHHMIYYTTHSASCRRLATSRDYNHLAANPDYNSNATGIQVGRATIRK